jgi:propanol-preferring alcohol dehydrogenase
VKAWQFTGTHDPLTIVEIPEPEPGRGEVLIDVKAAGICHTDVGMLEDETWLQITTLPVVPGHEIAGVVSRVGEGVTAFQRGERVAVWPMSSGVDSEVYGLGRNGGFESKVTVVEDALIRIPDGVDFDLAAMATDAGMTAHGAVVTSGEVGSGDKVGIIGFGGLGQLGARIAVLKGAEVHVVETNEAVWDRARRTGASSVVRDITELAGTHLNVIVDFAGFGTTTAGAIDAVAFGGRVVQVGMGKLESTISTYNLIMKRVRLIGNWGGNDADIAGVLVLMANGDLSPAIERTDFSGIADGIDRLRRGQVIGRLVAVFD